MPSVIRLIIKEYPAPFKRQFQKMYSFKWGNSVPCYKVLVHYIRYFLPSFFISPLRFTALPLATYSYRGVVKERDVLDGKNSYLTNALVIYWLSLDRIDGQMLIFFCWGTFVNFSRPLSGTFDSSQSLFS